MSGKEPVLTREVFARCAHTIFRVQVESGDRVELELREVSDLQRSHGYEQFAIVFCGPTESFLGQGIRTVEHDDIGRFDLFIVPIGHGPGGFRYEAVFNRESERPDAS